MKKILFALQVFAAIAIIPVYAASEMNHKTVTTVKAPVAENTGDYTPGLVSSISIFPMAALAFSPETANTSQKCLNDNCTCKDY
jgi:hypothetical protein